MKSWLLLVLLLSGCSTWTARDAVAPCVAADVVTTVVGLKSGYIVESLSPLKASMNAGHFAPFVLASIGLVMLVRWLDEPVVSGSVAAVECGLAAHNLLLVR